YLMTPALAARSRDNVIFGVVIQGTGFISQFDREAIIDVGSAVLLSGNDPSAFALRNRGRGLTLSLPRASFMPMIANPNGAFAKAIPANASGLRHLLEYLAIVQSDFVSMSIDLKRLVAQHITDLAVLAVGATQDVAEMAGRRGLR